METVNGGVIHSYPKVGVAAVILEEHLAQGDRIHIRGLHDDVHPSVTSREIEPVPVKEADRGQGIGIRVIERICGVIWCSAGAEGFFFFKKVY